MPGPGGPLASLRLTGAHRTRRAAYRLAVSLFGWPGVILNRAPRSRSDGAVERMEWVVGKVFGGETPMQMHRLISWAVLYDVEYLPDMTHYDRLVPPPTETKDGK